MAGAARLAILLVIAAAVQLAVATDDSGSRQEAQGAEPTDWEGQFEPAILEALMNRETRPEALRRIMWDESAFHERRYPSRWDWLTDPDVFHQTFRHRSILPIQSPDIAQDRGDIIVAAVWADTYGSASRDWVTDRERYPPVSDAGWEGVPVAGLEQDDQLVWEGFEPGGSGWDWLRYYVRPDGTVRRLSNLTGRGWFPRTVWWGDVTGDSQLGLVQWARRHWWNESEDGSRVSESLWVLEFWRMAWEPELLGAVLVAAGNLERARLPLYEFKPSREGADLIVELLPRFGIDLPLGSPAFRWNKDTGQIEEVTGDATVGEGWELVPLDGVRRSGPPREVSRWSFQLPRELLDDERWQAVDIGPLVAADELKKWQDEMQEQQLQVHGEHMFGDEPVEEDPPAHQFDRDPRLSWWGERPPPFELIEPDQSDLMDHPPREAVEGFVRRNMPEPLVGHYHVLVEPEAAADPWDAREGWLLRQQGQPTMHRRGSQGMQWDNLTTVGWRADGAAWLLRLSGLRVVDAPGWHDLTPENVRIFVATIEPSNAAWLASAWWWLDQHRTLTLTHEAPAGWPLIQGREPGYGEPPGPPGSRLWIHDHTGGVKLYLPAQVQGGRAWSGPWSRRTTHAFAERLFLDYRLNRPIHPVASLRPDQDPGDVWEHVRVWLDGSHPALTIDGLPPLPPALRVALVQAVAQANHQPGREWLQDLMHSLPEPDEAELALMAIVRRFEQAGQAWERTAGQPGRFSSEEAEARRETRAALEAAKADFLCHPWFRLRSVLPVALRQLDAWDDEAELRAWAADEDAPGQRWATRRLQQLTDEPP